MCVTSLTYNANDLMQSTLPWRQHLHTVWPPPPRETNAGNKQATNTQARGDGAAVAKPRHLQGDDNFLPQWSPGSHLNKSVAHQRQGGHGHHRLKLTRAKKPGAARCNSEMKGHRRRALDRHPLLPRPCCCSGVQGLAAPSSASCTAATQNPPLTKMC